MIDGLKIIVTTCDRTMWATQPFAYLFNTYWSGQQEVIILCESLPKFKLPANFKFHVIGFDDKKWPLDKWSDGLLKYLNAIKDQHVIILLDDYWLTRTVDVRGINTLYEFMRGKKNLLRIDLTTDRLYAGGVHNCGMYGHYDFVEAPQSPYQMSLMPGMWSKKLFMEIVPEGWTPWDVELTGTTVLNEDHEDIHVIGTRQNPVRFVNALRAGREDININDLDDQHVKAIMRFFPKDMEIVDFPWHIVPENRRAE
jgi:hypothetical protein